MNRYVFEKPIMIFKSEFNGRSYYKYSQSKKDVDGNYISAYKDCRFKKDVDIPNKTLIKPLEAWESFYKTDNKTYWYTFINKYELVETNNDSVSESNEVDLGDILNSDDNEYIENLDLPFDD